MRRVAAEGWRIEVAQPRAGHGAPADERADERMRPPEGDASLDQLISEVGGEEEAVGRRRHPLGAEAHAG